MPNTADEQRLRDLECDRRMAAGLFMAATAIAATRLAARFPASSRWLEPGDGSPILAPIVVLGALGIGAVAFLIAVGQERRLVAGAIAAIGAACTAAAVPFISRCVALFADAGPGWAAAIAAFTAFGLSTSLAMEDRLPTPRHAAISAAISIFALFQAAIDGTGIFAAILATMGIVFFMRWRHAPPA